MKRYWLLFIFTTITDARSPAVLIANDQGVLYYNTSSQESQFIIPYNARASDVDFDFTRGQIYAILKSSNALSYRIVRVTVPEDTKFRDTSMTNKSPLPQWCSNDRTCKEFQTKSLFQSPTGVLQPTKCLVAGNLVVDWIHNNLYWTCDQDVYLVLSRSTINMASTDGTNNKTIVHLSRDSRVSSIDIDPYDKKLFWLQTLKHGSSNIMWSDLKGTNETSIFQFSKRTIEKVLKISLDLHNKVIYVTKQLNVDKIFYLMSMDYEGENYKDIYRCKDSGWMFGPRVVNGQVFWTTNSTSVEDTCSTTKSSLEDSIYVKSFEVKKNVNQWRVYHHTVQTPALDCSPQNCSHHCRQSSWETIQCFCPAGFSLSVDNRTCSETSTSTSKPEAKVSQGDNQEADIDWNDSENSSTNDTTLLSVNNNPNGQENKGIDVSTVKSSSEKKAVPGEITSAISDQMQPFDTKQLHVQGSTPAESGVIINPTNSPAKGVESAADALINNVTKTAQASTTVVSSGSMTLFYIVVTTISLSLFVVVVIVKRKGRGNYTPPPESPEDRLDFMI